MGWKPKAPPDMFSRVSTNVESLEEFRALLQSSLRDAQYAYKVSRARQAANAASKCQEPTHQIGDQVWLKKELFMDAY